VEFRKEIAGDVAKRDRRKIPVMRLVRLLDDPSRKFRKDFEDNDEPVLRQAAARSPGAVCGVRSE